MAKDRIEGVASALTWELDMALGMVRASAYAFETLYSRLDGGEVSVEQAEQVEAQLDEGNRMLLGLAAKQAALRLYCRKMLVEANAPGWVVENGGIFFEGKGDGK